MEKARKTDKAQSFLMWVGSKGYPTIKSFIGEARKLGCSKRVSSKPAKSLVRGSRIFVAHDEGFEEFGVIFGYFIVSRLELILAPGEEIPENLKDRVIIVPTTEARKEPERGCGWRVEGGVYAVSFTDRETLLKIAEELGKGVDVRGGFVELENYVRSRDIVPNRFRGLLKVDGDDILTRSKDEEAAHWSDRVTPTNMAIKKYKITPAKEHRTGEWTENEDKSLLALVKKARNRAEGYRLFAIQSGRGIYSIAGRYLELVGTVGRGESEKEE